MTDLLPVQNCYQFRTVTGSELLPVQNWGALPMSACGRSSAFSVIVPFVFLVASIRSRGWTVRGRRRKRNEASRRLVQLGAVLRGQIRSLYLDVALGDGHWHAATLLDKDT